MVCILLFLFCMQGRSAYGNSPTAETSIIEIDVARFVAEQYVHKYYPKFQWLNVDHMVIHDIEGSVASYAFIFSKSTSTLRSTTDLQRHIVEKTAILNQILEKMEVQYLVPAKYLSKTLLLTKMKPGVVI